MIHKKSGNRLPEIIKGSTKITHPRDTYVYLVWGERWFRALKLVSSVLPLEPLIHVLHFVCIVQIIHESLVLSVYEYLRKDVEFTFRMHVFLSLSGFSLVSIVVALGMYPGGRQIALYLLISEHINHNVFYFPGI